MEEKVEKEGFASAIAVSEIQFVTESSGGRKVERGLYCCSAYMHHSRDCVVLSACLSRNAGLDKVNGSPSPKIAQQPTGVEENEWERGEREGRGRGGEML